MYCNIFLKKSFLLGKQNQRKNKNIVILKSAVTVDKTNYLDKMENLLNDTSKFKKI